MEQMDHLSALASLQSRFTTELADADPSAPVPSCGSWTVAELADHLGSVHIWAASTCTDQLPESDEAGLTTMAERYAARADLLLSTLREVSPHQECTTRIGRGPARFWHRRQAHETLIHLWDLHTALALMLWGRADQDSVTVTGEASVVETFLTEALTP
ncbi:maleylpyruvate isomerase N-terminal domain-containing protein [Nesterenkonia lacusekhoensis]|uniref:Mycothiol-dependent maleylpyruvate isomerase metal-binding domain-containing protein n=1 Tax=Nesterenkonia lacusekhoensis TaxID=150832 RepID=A0ABS4T3Z2_9MICC|nr:maleylpyruvate isomerase N-terminal domain-containing protein [Nesterenkonia lacusekhoensis]MBP2318578.1 hypothetical protein [Nesterenkonia lacusekhoensis]